MPLSALGVGLWNDQVASTNIDIPIKNFMFMAALLLPTLSTLEEPELFPILPQKYVSIL
jgi:hypothetical protein